MDSPNFFELNQQLTLIRDRVRSVVYRESTGFYLHGPPGTSKTHTVCRTLGALAVNRVVRSGHLTPLALFKLLEENHNSVIVLDDISAIFNQPIALQLLLAALGSSDPTGGRIVQYETAKESKTVRFTGGIVCISNLSLDGHHHEVLTALRDRINVLAYNPTEEQLVSLIHHIADNNDAGVAPADARVVADFLIEESRARGVRISVRQFDKALKDYRLYAANRCETHWRDLVKSSVQQQVIPLQHPTNTKPTRYEQIRREQLLVQDIEERYECPSQRIAEWYRETGKSSKSYYRRSLEIRQTPTPN